MAKIKNIDTVDHTWGGIIVEDGTSYTTNSGEEEQKFAADSGFIADLSNSKAEVYDANDNVITDVATALDYLKHYSSPNPKTEDARDIIVINCIPLGYTIYPTGQGDNITNGTYGDGDKILLTDVTPGTTDKATLQFLSHWFGIGGRVIWESASVLDEMNAMLVAPATTGAVEQAGDYDKYALGGGANMFIPATPGAGAWDIDLTAKLTNTDILKCTPVPAAGNTGYFDYNSATNVLTVNSGGAGGYNLYDFDVNLFRFANTIFGRKQDGAESLLEASDVIGKLLFNCWQIRFTLDATTTGVKCAVIITTAIKKNI